MPPSPIPAPLPPWARAILRVLPWLSAAWQAAVQYAGDMRAQVEAETPDEWRRVVMKIEDTTSLDTADDQFITFDIVNITNGAIDNTWDDGDRNDVFNNLDLIAAFWAAHMAARLRFAEMRFYRMAFHDYGYLSPIDGKPRIFVDSGPPEDVRVMSHQGLAAGIQAPQVAVTVTERVTLRPNWGRFYLPGPSSTNVVPSGRLDPTVVDQLAQVVHDAYNSLAIAELFPVVPITQAGGVAQRALATVTGVRVDDVQDVQRRRRLTIASHKADLPLP